MLLTVEELRRHIVTDIPDDELRLRLSAIETAIRKHTNNHFAIRDTLQDALIEDGKIIVSHPEFIREGDTIEIFSEPYKDKVFTVTFIEGNTIETDGDLRHGGNARIALVSYPDDVVMGAVNLIRWDISNREKVGVKSESLSRWSVTYYDLEANSLLGYPSSLLGFARNYRRARF